MKKLGGFFIKEPERGYSLCFISKQLTTMEIVMTTLNKYNNKKQKAVLTSLTFLMLTPSLSYTSENLQEENQRLELFGLLKFNRSFEVDGNILQQMNQRSIVWDKLYLRENVKKEVLEYPSNQNKLIGYIPYYLNEILDVKSVTDLNNKDVFFSDFVTLLETAALKGSQFRETKEKISKINFKGKALYPIFLKYLALHNSNLSLYPTYVQEEVDKIRLEEESYKQDRYKYRRNLKERYEEDKRKLIELSNLKERNIEDIKSLILL
jgi:hypothetical protein